MSEGRRLDGPWIESIAAARGIAIDPGRARAVAAAVAPVLGDFAAIAASLSADDDVQEFRRVLEREAAGG